MLKVDLDAVYRQFAICPDCGEDWSWGYTKPELVKFATARKNKKLICRRCKNIYPFKTLIIQLVRAA